jgi:hypothetical protein
METDVTTGATMRVRPPMTRMEVAQVVGDTFGTGPVTRERLIETAERAGARPEVVAALRGLPGREFIHLRQLWSDLPEMPVR